MSNLTSPGALARLYGRATRERWPISDDHREAIVKTLTEIMLDPKQNAKSRTAAAKAIITAEAQNQRDDRTQAILMDQRLIAIANLPNGTLRDAAMRAGLLEPPKATASEPTGRDEPDGGSRAG